VTADPHWLTTPGPAHLRRTALAARAADLAAASGPGVTLRETPPLAMVNLRVAPRSDAARRVEDALGARSPGANAVAPASLGAVLWLGPDELLVVAGDGEAPGVVALLTEALGGDPGSVVDVSAARAGVDLAGPRAADVLAKGCSIDLHPRAFPPGRCAQTLLARANVVVWHLGEPLRDGGYRVLTGASFAGYLADWLVDAAAEYQPAGDSQAGTTPGTPDSVA
jgi:sarcosine oxidase subunit gamma